MENNETIEKGDFQKKVAKVKKPHEKVERLVLKSQTLDRLDGWLQQIEKAFVGIKLKRSELVEWLADSQGEVLSEDSLKKIRGIYYDDIQMMKWALSQAEEAKASGKPYSIQHIMQHIKA